MKEECKNKLFPLRNRKWKEGLKKNAKHQKLKLNNKAILLQSQKKTTTNSLKMEDEDYVVIKNTKNRSS